ncbi:hypothetical protein EV689_101283 [Avibacterium gallinarum]|uniref:Uncharacterized protein n=1 Tax=Avibacterium gallinarum TaxID=755 RepID=A0A379AX13_AVIGA|nr:hypothetical protein EV689_101283 [Avibacterium gallinarum]SUB26753.1 Uncharacterised protein [Avibacterium gallinarum]
MTILDHKIGENAILPCELGYLLLNKNVQDLTTQVLFVS